MSRLTRDGTAEPVSRDQILMRERGQGNIHFTCSAAPFNPYSALCDNHTYIHTMVVQDVAGIAQPVGLHKMNARQPNPVGMKRDYEVLIVCRTRYVLFLNDTGCE